jgi:hypothetical protein
MADTFNERGKGFEAKFKLDQETEFKIEARRNKLLGLWLAEKLGINESETQAYAGTVVAADLEEPGVEDVVRKCMADIVSHGANVTEQDIRGKIEEFNGEARQQIIGA